MNDNKPSMYDLFNDDSLWGNQTAGGLTNEEILYKNWNKVRTAEQNKKISERVSATLLGRPSKVKGKTQSAEHKAKNSAAKKGKTHSDETKIKMSAAKKGKTHSAEIVTKRLETLRRNREAKRAQGIPNPLKGKKKSPESIAKGIETLRLKREANLAKGIQHPNKGRKKSPEAEAKRQETRRRNREAKLAAAQVLTQTE